MRGAVDNADRACLFYTFLPTSLSGWISLPCNAGRSRAWRNAIKCTKLETIEASSYTKGCQSEEVEEQSNILIIYVESSKPFLWPSVIGLVSDAEAFVGPQSPSEPLGNDIQPSLKRAQGLLTAAGKPSTPALQSNNFGRSSSDCDSNDHRGRNRGLSESTSVLRRTLSGVKSGLLRRSATTGTAAKRGGKYRRSKSENLGKGARHLQLHQNTTSNVQSLSPDIGEADSTTDSESDFDTTMDSEDVKRKTITLRIDPDGGYILWDSRKSGTIPIENIKEIRSGADTRYYREQFHLSADYEARWLTIIYNVDGSWKILHAVAATPDVFTLWDHTLRALLAVRQELMSGLGHVEKRQMVWERRYWRGADEQRDDRLEFEEVKTLCRRLNISTSNEDLMRRFHEADTQKRGYLDFNDFRRFVKLLKDRPELKRLYRKLIGDYDTFNFGVFEKFMRTYQKSSLSREELEYIFRKYASSPQRSKVSSPIDFPPTPPPSSGSLSPFSQAECEAPKPSELQPEPVSSTDALNSSALTTPPSSGIDAEPPATSFESEAKERKTVFELTMSLDSFTTFLLSSDNSVFCDQHGKICQDMTRPLSEYYISSSHNTYLVGSQLVGVSTIEGYIRALLHNCRSVEIDIYDGEVEPVIYHGKTLTSKVPLRDICQAIAKYAFVASPYPVIISAEVHCSVTQQDLIASIMHEEFGSALVSAPVDGRPHITELPSPENLRGRVLIKAKNLRLMKNGGLKEKSISVDVESSTTDTSASDSEFVHDIRVELKHELSRARNNEAVREIREEFQKVRNVEPIAEIKEEFSKARSLYHRPISVTTSPPQLTATKSSSSSLSTEGPPISTTEVAHSKVKMSFALAALLVYTVGVKCRGFNKKETYAPEHLFSLSERTANKVVKQSMLDLIKHNRTHIVRIYPNGTRLNSSNFEPHKYWSAGAQLVAINWQTFDLGYMINHAMFQRNGGAGYVLKPPALRNANKGYLSKRTNHILDIKIISAQQLPRRKDSEGREIIDNNVVDPFVEVSIHVPDWGRSPISPDTPAVYAPGSTSTPSISSAARTTTVRTGVVKNNGFNPVWEESLQLAFDVVADMRDLVFVRFVVRDEGGSSETPLAVYCVPLGSMQLGYRHLPLHDAQLSQYLFSTLFVRVNVRDI
ncbi:hypothetical protein EW145_g2843 [Phellinidium pouzarii]|uniref:Phosphoinositide phospholipase C n=1 Tax=Phellinidium pouzarii TaxID=167371 RepID=A0A4S4LAW3_9AGAM|nr:hypothetical protein EW145_g2843 [Phellinidium pouzarii]